MPEVVIALGTNVGDRLGHMREALALLGFAVELRAASAVYETAPMYVLDQPAFLNAAVAGTTDLAPHRLLGVLKGIEAAVGRRTSVRYGPREIDLDLIVYGSLAYTYRPDGEVRLQVPHPRTPERRFVLAPLADLGADRLLPGLGRVGELLARTDHEADTVQRVGDAVLSL